MKPVVRSPLRDQIRKDLIEGLITGRWEPGERIVERRVAAELGVSQAPVREALRELESLRLIESSPNRGARVRPITRADLREVYQVRAGLEETAARLGRPSAAELASHLTSLRTTDPHEQVRHGVAFHRAIVAAAGNQVLLDVWESLGIEVWTHLSIRLFRMEPQENAADHEPLVAAFSSGDPGVGALLREHVLAYAP
ncbi:GntR family transcriptional regulator [Nonomuraea sp. NBC_01738]|uniref:GntR family transcriptional regulator n=1 Tax=Nonomuraea sp. NBC_01738 TaxID=2976003 RepID=UPI002E143F56|nr:GntR family transcriptional regulator [Nonomuraea sp. NBC_01738]